MALTDLDCSPLSLLLEPVDLYAIWPDLLLELRTLVDEMKIKRLTSRFIVPESYDFTGHQIKPTQTSSPFLKKNSESK
jgi:hypothetical protein